MIPHNKLLHPPRRCPGNFILHLMLYQAVMIVQPCWYNRMMKPSIQQLLNSATDNYRSQVGVSFDQARSYPKHKSLSHSVSWCSHFYLWRRTGLGVWYNSCKHQLALLLLVKRSTQFKHLTALDVRVNIAVQQGTSYMFIVHQFTSFLKGTLFKKCFFLLHPRICEDLVDIFFDFSFIWTIKRDVASY